MHRTKVRVVEDALDANNTIAAANRSDFERASVTVVNLMSAPGAGKTTLLERALGGLAEDGLRGVTSNPSIVEKAIGHGDDYDALIAEAEASGYLDPGALFEDLAVRDIQEGADTLNTVYEQTQRRDGFISLEVSPYLAMNTHETIEEARRLWH